ncbi:aspartyl protease family protein At5g10770-like [Pyrus x bretschneideri]|uniref:aspartyl protease family protein At5g10770-like n=1 Tax=Pyrus x bretschneideri TaxID=225117 RepID=UPI00202FAEBB|nr:aspartyl protease family protein At5g10770-like [Pyrus x bretschneideri]
MEIAPMNFSSFFFRSFGLYVLFLCLVLCSLEKGFALAGRKDKLTHHTVQLNSLLPATTCTPSTKGHNKKHGSVLEVVHKHGPCYEHNQHKTKTATDLHAYYAQFFKQDQARVDSIYSRLKATKRYSTKTDDNLPITQSEDTNTFPAPSATTVGGSGNYVVKVGLGTPAKSFSLVFDTGSDLTWTQCQPCRFGTGSDLTASYANISCNTATCNELTSATNTGPYCYRATNTCVYLIGYGDKSKSAGYYGTERLTLTATSTDVFDGFLFGCGQNNGGTFVGFAGLLGLGRNKISLIEQTAAKYGRYFSYCLPVDQSSTGFLRLGKDGGNSAAVKFTPLTTLPVEESFYGLDLVGISVSGQQVSIPSTVFSTGTLIDSGTVITRLPAAAYTAMRDAFREGMKSYGEPKTVEGVLDTCYDLRAYNLETVSFPAVAFTFSGGLTLELKLAGTVIVIVDTSQVCLAILPSTKDGQPGIIGNFQQIGFEVVYDVAGGKIGFAAGSC